MSEIVCHPARNNQLLAQLPDIEWERLLPHLEAVDLPQGSVLYESSPSTHVYFPTTATVSLLYLTEDGASPEIAVVGREGLVANTDYFGHYAHASQAVVQSAGAGYRIRSQVLKTELDRSIVLLRLMMDYAQDLFRQLAQTIVSSRHQAVEEQVCRRLLMGLDRLRSNTITMTHELLGNMLNVRRECITKAAGHLQNEGLIRYYRGRITIIDRAGLEAKAGECYAMMR